jgi:sulfatase maturation enzyme AslB (radical SAM superfamily)
MTHPRIDLKNQTFSEAWKDLTAATDQVRLSSLCESCTNRNVCHPCAAVAAAETGSSSGVPTYMCNAIHELCKLAREHLHIEDKTP